MHLSVILYKTMAGVFGINHVLHGDIYLQLNCRFAYIIYNRRYLHVVIWFTKHQLYLDYKKNYFKSNFTSYRLLDA